MHNKYIPICCSAKMCVFFFPTNQLLTHIDCVWNLKLNAASHSIWRERALKHVHHQYLRLSLTEQHPTLTITAACLYSTYIYNIICSTFLFQCNEQTSNKISHDSKTFFSTHIQIVLPNAKCYSNFIQNKFKSAKQLFLPMTSGCTLLN